MALGRNIIQIGTLFALLAGGGGYLFFNRDIAKKELAPVVALPDDITLADPTKVISRVVGIPLGGAQPPQPTAPTDDKKAAQPPAATTTPAPAPGQAQTMPAGTTAATPAPSPTSATPAAAEAKPEAQQAEQPKQTAALPPQPQQQPIPPQSAPAPQAAPAPPPTPAAPGPTKVEIAERDFASAMDKFKAGDKSVIPELERIAGDTAKPAQSVHTVAWLLAQNRQVDEAVAQFRRAATLDPTDQVIRQNLATVLAQTGKNAEAYTAVAELLKLNPEHGLGQRLKSVLEQRCGGPCK